MPRLKQFPIRAKLFGLAGILLAFTALIGFMSVRGLAAVDAKGGSMYRDRAVPLHDLGDARSALGMIDNQLLRTIVGGVDDTKQLRAAQASVDEVIEKYKATELVDAEKRGLAAFDATWREYKNADRDGRRRRSLRAAGRPALRGGRQAARRAPRSQ